MTLEASVSAKQQERGIKDIKIAKEEVKLFADDIIMHIEDLKESIKQQSELVSEFSKVIRNEVFIKKSNCISTCYH